MIRIELSFDNRVIGVVERLATSVSNTSGLMKIAADSVADVCREHFVARNQQPNKRGWEKSGFWGEIAQATNRGTTADTEATVIIADLRLAIHVYGGDIRPVEKRALTTPINPLAKGVRASVLEDQLGVKIFKLAPKKGKADSRGILAATIGGKLVPLYALRSRVRIPKDPQAMPSPQAMTDTIAIAVDDWLATTGGAA